MNQLSITATGPETDPAQSQWLTPPAVAAGLVGLAGELLDDATRMGPVIERRSRGCLPALSPTEQAYYQRLDGGARALRILEPSAGRGNLVRAICARAPGASIDAVELDPRWAHELRVMGGCRVHEGDYLMRPAPGERYDLAIVNPPYDGGRRG